MIEQPKFINTVESRPIQPQVIVDRDWIKNIRAEFAQELIRGAMMQPAFGASLEHYQELQTLPITDVVHRACELADAAFNEFERRGWLIKIPLYDDLVQKLQAEDTPRKPGF